MRILLLCGLALGVVPLPGQPGEGPFALTAVYTEFEHEPPPLVVDSLKRELTSIMSPAGMPLEWRSLAAPRTGETFSELAVVTFKGTCDLSGLIPRRIDTGALGFTHLTDRQIIPFSEVDCDRIRGFLSKALVPMGPPDREEVFGRAIARVVAHELYHIFTKTVHHGSSGLSQATYTVRDLMADDFCFAEADQLLLTSLSAANRRHGNQGAPASGWSVFAGSGCIRCHGARAEGTVHGPSLHVTGRSFEVGQLIARLTGKASEMYRRARNRKSLWPSLPKGDIDTLIAYLNNTNN
jgi:hypothetical protein